MKDSRYYVRIHSDDVRDFEIYLSRNAIKNEFVGLSFAGQSSIYTMRLTREQATVMKLSFNLKGFLDFNRTPGKKFSKNVVDIPY